tara:strand:- start:36 stop:224 length:189 start_codon:yes stop_codon:yes gene_type:complete
MLKGRTQKDYCLELFSNNSNFKKEIIDFLNELRGNQDLKKLNNHDLCNVIISYFFDVDKMSK